MLPMISLQNFEIFTFVTPSRGGFQALGKLSAAYADLGDPALCPVVALSTDSYMHKVKAYGTIYVPVFNVVKYVPAARFNAILASARGERTAQSPVSEPEVERPARQSITSGRQSAPPEAPPIDDDGYAGVNPSDIEF